jgi:hypothetical protein
MNGCDCGLCRPTVGDPMLEHVNALAQQLDDADRVVLLLMAQQLFESRKTRHRDAPRQGDGFSREVAQRVASAVAIFRQAARSTGGGGRPFWPDSHAYPRAQFFDAAPAATDGHQDASHR